MDAAGVVVLLWLTVVAGFVAMAAVDRADRLREEEILDEHKAWQARFTEHLAVMMEKTRTARRYMTGYTTLQR